MVVWQVLSPLACSSSNLTLTGTSIVVSAHVGVVDIGAILVKDFEVRNRASPIQHISSLVKVATSYAYDLYARASLSTRMTVFVLRCSFSAICRIVLP